MDCSESLLQASTSLKNLDLTENQALNQRATMQLKSRLTSMHKKKEYEAIRSLYKKAVIADSQHPLFSEYEPLSLGRRLYAKQWTVTLSPRQISPWGQ